MHPGVYLAQVIIALTARLLADGRLRHSCMSWSICGHRHVDQSREVGSCAARCSARHERVDPRAMLALTLEVLRVARWLEPQGARKSRFACKFLSEDKSGRASCETGMERRTALAQKGDGVRPKQLLTGRSEAAHSLGASDAREAHASDETRPCPQPAASPPNPRPRRVPLPASNDLTSD